MNCCTAWCGWCGACTTGPGREKPTDERDWEFCDNVACGNVIGPTTGRVALSGVGVFCSRTCADVGAVHHEQTMRRQSA